MHFERKNLLSLNPRTLASSTTNATRNHILKFPFWLLENSTVKYGGNESERLIERHKWEKRYTPQRKKHFPGQAPTSLKYYS